MDTVRHTLEHAVPSSLSTGVNFISLEQASAEPSPLALVWYTTRDDAAERAARIDLDKQVFLDDFGSVDRSAFTNEAQLIVNFLSAIETRRSSAYAIAGVSTPLVERLSNPYIQQK